MAATPTEPVRPRPVVLVLAALAMAAMLVAPAMAEAQEVPTTTVPELLVPGDTTPTTAGGGAPATTTTETPATDDGGLFHDVDANTKVWIIVGGLVTVAVLIAILTIIYWRHTRPAPVDADAEGGRRPSRRERRKAKKLGQGQDDAAKPPLDLDDLLARPDPARSVFATDPEKPGPPGES